MTRNIVHRIGRHTSIAFRLGFAIAVPLLAVAILATMMITEQWQVASKMSRLQELSQFTTRISGLVHELQKERGMSAVFLNSGGQQLAADIPGQRRTTSEQLTAVHDAAKQLTMAGYPAGVRQAIETGLAATRELDAKREDITAKRIVGPDSNKFFTGLIGQLLAVPREAVKSSEEPAVTANLLAYYSYLAAKERAGQERATGAVGFGAGQFNAAQHRTYLTALSEQRAYFEAFEAYGTTEQRAFARQTVSGPVVEDVERMRLIAVEAGAGSPLGDVKGAAWFKATTARIDLMKQVEIVSQAISPVLPALPLPVRSALWRLRLA